MTDWRDDKKGPSDPESDGCNEGSAGQAFSGPQPQPQPAAPNPAEEALRRSAQRRGTGLQRLVKKVDRAIARTTGELQAYGDALAALIRERALLDAGAEAPVGSPGEVRTGVVESLPAASMAEMVASPGVEEATPTATAVDASAGVQGIPAPPSDQFAVHEFTPGSPAPPSFTVEMPPPPPQGAPAQSPAAGLQQSGFQRLIKKVDRAIKRSTEEVQIHAQALSRLIQQRRSEQTQPQQGEALPLAGEAAPARPAEAHQAGLQETAASVRRVIRRKTAEMANFRDQLARLVEETRQKEQERQQAIESLPQPEILEPPPELLDKYRYASLCPSRWEDLSGSERYRLCKQCHLFVYDFEKMDLGAVKKLVFQREGITDPTFYKRQDGRFLTRDCPVGVQRRQKRIAAVAVVLLLAGSVIGLYVLMPPPPPPQVAREVQRQLPGIGATVPPKKEDKPGSRPPEQGRARFLFPEPPREIKEAPPERPDQPPPGGAGL